MELWLRMEKIFKWILAGSVSANLERLTVQFEIALDLTVMGQSWSLDNAVQYALVSRSCYFLTCEFCLNAIQATAGLGTVHFFIQNLEVCRLLLSNLKTPAVSARTCADLLCCLLICYNMCDPFQNSTEVVLIEDGYRPAFSTIILSSGRT